MSNNEMRLARLDLGEGWLDMGYGETILLQRALERTTNFTADKINYNNLLNACYQPPKGRKDLVDLLEKKFGSDVVVTNGAKQGISAVMYALKQLGHKSCAIHAPYWVSTPGLIEDAGLAVEMLHNPTCNSKAFMLTSPNNPDGGEISTADMLKMAELAKLDDVVFIHDAAYHTPIYTSNADHSVKVGDAQIYSIAKMYGLSGLRIGYVVVHNPALLPGIMEYVERSCSGVSTASQQIVYDLESYFTQYPDRLAQFNNECRQGLIDARKELELLPANLLTAMPCNSNSMFAWCKVNAPIDFKKLKINVIDGALFGQPGFIRINLAVGADIVREVVARLNASSA